ncbi:cytochrome c3 family protein [Desulforhopalus sp. IMCC35007]|uniref:cytochrome c3 family protein n=1 Tax=Desulforhopalus sp. IMCC35007 TaxID=2569543 RepID=UPI00145F4ED8|nr:cytochrome c3 family protein [Desulforhopalus sp. IMCC35007]
MNKKGPRQTMQLLCLLGIIFLTSSVLAEETGPAEVTMDQLAELYEPVLFDHAMHTEIYDCSRCHHSSDLDGQPGECAPCHSGRASREKNKCSGCHRPDNYDNPSETNINAINRYHIDTPGLKASWHLLCRNCHLQDSGPTGCRDCHEYSQKGKKLFHEKQ